MTANSHLKYQLCVEWMTELPFDRAPRKSTSISLWGSEWYLELKCGLHMGEFELTLHNACSPKFMLNKMNSVTTSLGCGLTYEPPMLTDQRSFRQSGDFLWKKSKEKVLSEIPRIFFSGKVKIFCIFHSIEIKDENTLVVNQIDPASSITATSSRQSLYNDFSPFLKKESFSDVKLMCADRVFPAHMLVLAAHSKIFADMFRNTVAENATGVFDIKDLDPDVLELVLQYMYSAKRPVLNKDKARRLYKAADRYAVHVLKKECSDWMLVNYTVNEFLDLLVLADEHSDKSFKESLARDLAINLSSLSFTSWSTFKEKYPQLAFLVLEKRLPAPPTKFFY